MENMRNNPPETMGGYNVEAVRDYQTGKIINTLTGKEEKTNTAKSNVLYYELNDDAWCAIRPSGTEPKMKVYSAVKGESLTNAEEKLKRFNEKVMEIINEKLA